MNEILEQQKKLASGNLDDESRSNIEAYIKVLQTNYQTAPDTMGSRLLPSLFKQSRKTEHPIHLSKSVKS